MAGKKDQNVARIVGEFLELHDHWLGACIRGEDATPIVRSLGEVWARMTPDEKRLTNDFASDVYKSIEDALAKVNATRALRQFETSHRPGFLRRLWLELRRFLEGN